MQPTKAVRLLHRSHANKDIPHDKVTTNLNHASLMTHAPALTASINTSLRLAAGSDTRGFWDIKRRCYLREWVHYSSECLTECLAAPPYVCRGLEGSDVRRATVPPSCLSWTMHKLKQTNRNRPYLYWNLSHRPFKFLNLRQKIISNWAPGSVPSPNFLPVSASLTLSFILDLDW